jgi:flagellar basal-body rod protein FlgG
MLRALYTAASGMMAQQTNLDNIANNLANSSTTGFRKRRVQFQDLVYQTMVAPGSASSAQTTEAGLQVGLGVRTAATEIIQTQGDYTQTDNQLDVDIQGNGFFQITMPSGQIAYTRSGNFHLDSSGNVVTSDGYPISPALTIPTNATAISIGSDGTVTATIPNQTTSQTIGNIQLATFPNSGGLSNIGGNLMVATSASGDPIVGTPGSAEGLGTLQQGYLEQSNVSVVEEFVQMIVAQRSYEANSKVVTAADEMFQQVNNLQRS